MNQAKGYKFYKFINEKHTIGVMDEDDLIILLFIVVISFIASMYFLIIGVPFFAYYLSVIKRKNTKGYIRNLILLFLANKHHPHFFSKEFNN